MRQLTVYDILVFQVMCEAPGISIRECHRKVNERIILKKIPSDYAETTLNKSSVDTSLDKLREGGLIHPNSREILPSATRFWGMIGNDWRNWPYGIPVKDYACIYIDISWRHQSE